MHILCVCQLIQELKNFPLWTVTNEKLLLVKRSWKAPKLFVGSNDLQDQTGLSLPNLFG